MVYMGSKSKIADIIIPILHKIIKEKNIETYIEPFVGGANIIDKVECNKKIGYDNSKTLIALLNTARDDFNLIPSEGSREWFERARAIYRGMSDEEMEDYLIGAIQWLGSYGTRGFPGGYAPEKDGRVPYTQRFNNLKAQSPHLKGIEFYNKDFHDIEIPNKSLVYCDPPYFGTKTYGYAFESKFDHEDFWNWVREKSKTSYVVVSEETVPDDFEIIKEVSKRRTLKKENDMVVVEKLVTWKYGLLGKC